MIINIGVSYEVTLEQFTKYIYNNNNNNKLYIYIYINSYIHRLIVQVY